MSRDIAPFGLRMQPELKEKVIKAAKDSGRSLNAEICHRLEKTFSDSELDSEGDLADQMQELRQRLERLEKLVPQIQK